MIGISTYFVCAVYIIAVCVKGAEVALASSYLVMIVMEFGTSIERDQLRRAKWEVVAAV